MFADWERETPLTDAVIRNDQKAVEQLCQDARRLEERNFLGFNGVEIARFLDRRNCLEYLEETPSRTCRVRLKGESQFREITEDEFQKVFGVRYLRHLIFASYNLFKAVILHCPKKYSEPLEHLRVYEESLRQNLMPKFYIDWIDETLGYGLFADELITHGTLIGSYFGEVRRAAFWLAQNDHSIFYPSATFISYAVDGQAQGNEMRFINHSAQGNLTSTIIPDRGLLSFTFLANRDILQGEQLLWNYGKDFWSRRNPPLEI